MNERDLGSIENPAGETLVPLSVLHRRFKATHKLMLKEARNTPWWNFKRRYIAHGAAAAYAVEIENLLRLGGATVLARLKAKL